MYSTTPSNPPAAQAGYTPYFYQAGVFMRYLVTPVATPRRPQQGLETAIEASSQSAFFPNPERFQTVEQIIQRGYFAAPSSDPETALISDRLHTARFGLGDVIEQLRNRYQIYEQNMYELTQAACEVQNCLFRQLAEHGCLVANQRQMYSTTKQVQKLYEQQRDERINLWRDVSRLRLALPETVQNYLTAYRKVSLLEDQGDGP